METEWVVRHAARLTLALKLKEASLPVMVAMKLALVFYRENVDNYDRGWITQRRKLTTQILI